MEPGVIFFTFLKFCEVFWYKNPYFFFIAYKKFQDKNMFSSEDVSENVTSYGNY